MLFRSPVRSENFTWRTNFNIAHNENKILELADGVERYSLGGFDNLNVYAMVGGDYGEIYGTKFARVDDENSPYYGQLVLNSSGLPTATGAQYLGTQQASANLGWTNEFSWKNLSFAFQIDARVGGKIFSGTQQMMQSAGTAACTVVNGAREEFVVPGVYKDGDGNYVVNENKVTPQQYWSAVSGTGNLGIGEANLYDATNVRLRNLSINYSLPKRLLARTRVFQSIKVGFSMTNVCMIYSAMRGLDPESVYATSTNATGFEYGSIPTSRSYVFNISLGF